MNPNNQELDLIKEKFPGQAEYIERLFTNDEHFRELCSDYLVCIQNLERSIQDIEERKAWVQEYGHLRTDLERELSHFISEVTDKSRNN